MGVLEQFNWRRAQAYDLVWWIGEPKVLSRGAGTIMIYLRGTNVLYVGCGRIDECMHMNMRIGPQKVYSSEGLMGPDVVDRMYLRDVRDVMGINVRVHGETFEGEVRERMGEFLCKSMVTVGMLSYIKSGSVTQYVRAVYDVGNGKLYKFIGPPNEYMLGCYQGEMALEEYRKLRDVSAKEKACLALKGFKVLPAKAAAPSFELEFCRTHEKFQLSDIRPNTGLFIELLSKSGLVKRVAQSIVEDKLVNYQRETLGDGSRVISGKDASGPMYLLGILYKDMFYGFEAGFDMLEFAKMSDQKVVRGRCYANPNGGYLTVVNRDELFAVTPVN